MAGGANACAVDVGGSAEAIVLPDDDVVLAVKGEARVRLSTRSRRDRDRGVVENRAVFGDALAKDVSVCTGRPGHEVVRPVEGDPRRIPTWCDSEAVRQRVADVIDESCVKGVVLLRIPSCE